MGSCPGFQPSLPCSDCSSSLFLKPKLLLHQQLNNVLGPFAPMWCYAQTPYLRELSSFGLIALISPWAVCALDSPSTIPSTTKRTVCEHQLTQYCQRAACALPMGRLRPPTLPNNHQHTPLHKRADEVFHTSLSPSKTKAHGGVSTWGPHSHLGVLYQSTVGPSPPRRVQPAL